MLGSVKCPAPSEVVVREYWLTELTIVTVAPGTTAPVESVTVPEIVPEVAPDWAKAGLIQVATKRNRNG